MSPLLLTSLAFMFVAVALLTGGVTYVVLDWQAPGRRRLRDVPAPGGRPAAGADGIAPTDNATAGKLARFVPKSPADMNKLRRRLVRAGYHGPTAAAVFAISEVLGPIVLGAPVLFLV